MSMSINVVEPPTNTGKQEVSENPIDGNNINNTEVILLNNNVYQKEKQDEMLHRQIQEKKFDVMSKKARHPFEQQQAQGQSSQVKECPGVRKLTS